MKSEQEWIRGEQLAPFHALLPLKHWPTNIIDPHTRYKAVLITLVRTNSTRRLQELSSLKRKGNILITIKWGGY